MHRLSLATLMIGIATLAVAGACLLYPESPLAHALPVVATGFLLTSILGVILHKGARRAFWIGFAIFSWGYLLIMYGPLNSSHQLNTSVFYLARPMHRATLTRGEPVPRDELPQGTVDIIQAGNNQMIPLTGADLGEYLRLVNWELALLFGLIGSQVATRFYRRTQRTADE